ncbi:ATP-dependent helicase [Bifidobacterium xylocopae]|uniref:ATP-dependent helicase n=1 Tax=Bifidobacterium xylocopae TaxID=2493119 RepID=A0A366KEK9_9BIFI|nr:ATP-dependent helicase [Bifidobacterium xylocopae]RBP99553.1 ATP-dependent helicase [Bifidobacterium xylocopae]
MTGNDGVLEGFSAQTRAWFAETFGRPTQVQAAAWPAIRSGDDALVVAPTGSGKTLAAFLWAIDTLLAGAGEGPGRRRKADTGAAAGVKVLYVSPLKALGADVARNLETPLEGVADVYEAQGLSAPSVSVAVRSGDTDAKGRRAIATHPPDILVTTPESLYLMLTSKARKALSSVHTVIIDEIHALAGSKRGAHLALSLERLDVLTGSPAQRIGLSATVRPLDQVAAFLGGDRPVTIVNPAGPARLDLKVVEPVPDMSDLGTGKESGTGQDDDRSAGTRSVWPAIEESILQQVLAHHTTLVFVNSRGLAEKLTARLNELAGDSRKPHRKQAADKEAEPDGPTHYSSVNGSTSQRVCAGSDTIAMAHHGSVSKERRRQIEQALKAGELRCVVATSSLELGIDMGSIDLVIQVAPPLSVASGLQRVGRADHQVGAESHALIYPVSRREILQAAASAEAMLSGAIEPTHVLANPLDVLAQQTVAAAAMDELKVDDWYELVRRAAPYHRLDRGVFDSVIAMLSGEYSSERFRLVRPILVWDRKGGTLAARPGAQRLAVTSGGTIPDRGSYSVVLPQEESSRAPRRVGELDEEMVYESRVGDIITLGTTSWRIRQITNDRVIVQPAPGRSARLPFWHGEGVGRDAGFGRNLGRMTRQLADGLTSASQAAGEGGKPSARFDHAATRRLSDAGLDSNSLDNLAALLAEQRASTGLVPSDRDLVVERCPDEEGDCRIILHSPYGRRVHEPWALAVSARLKRERGYDGSVYAADDGIVLRLPQEDINLPVARLFVFDPTAILHEIRAEVTASALFAGRFRQVAARSLFMPRAQPGRRVPLWQQRLRASQLQQAAQEQGNFPLLAETMRECLEDVYDLPALQGLMRSIAGGQVRLTQVDTPTPSPFASGLLFGYVGAYMYLYDMPQAERQAAMLSIDPDLLAKLVGRPGGAALMDPELAAGLEAELQCLPSDRRRHGAEGVADLLRLLGPLTAAEIRVRLKPVGEVDGRRYPEDSILSAYLGALEAQGRVARTRVGGRFLWSGLADAERLKALQAYKVDDRDSRKAFAGLVATYAATHGPFTTGRIADRFDMNPALAKDGLEALSRDGRLLGGLFVPPEGLTTAEEDGLEQAGGSMPPGQGREASTADGQWIDPQVFRRLRSRSLARARKAARPVEPAVYSRFLLNRQGVAAVGRGRFRGPDGLLGLLQSYEGVYLPIDLWEGGFLPARMADFRPAMLDELLSAGELIWLGRRTGGESGGQLAFYAADSPLLALPVTACDGTRPTVTTDEAEDDDGPAGLGLRLHAALASGGSYHFKQLLSACLREQDDTNRVSQWLVEALWRLVWQGRLTASTLAPIRRLTAAAGDRRPRTPYRTRRAVRPVLISAAGRHPAVPTESTAMLAAGLGLWSLPPQPDMRVDGPSFADHTQLALEAAQQVLERDGVASPLMADQLEAPFSFSQLYPVFKRLEDADRLMRGSFVSGFGGAQFAQRETVAELRQGQERQVGQDDDSVVVLDARDPANLYGKALPWPPLEGHGSGPAPRPSRRAGALVVLYRGSLVLYAAPQGHHLLVFTGADRPVLDVACRQLEAWLRARRSGAVFFKDLNGRPFQADSPVAQALRHAGFTFGPQGMKLY